MVLSISKDLYDVLKYSDKYLTEEELLESYVISAQSPTDFERVLIRQGSTTLEECKENRFAKSRIDDTKSILEEFKR